MKRLNVGLFVERFLFTKCSTIGKLYINDLFVGYTLEPSVHSKKLIDEDTYICAFSPTPEWSRFHGDERYGFQIRVEDKNGRKGILFHIGNYPQDTEGCILVGTSHGIDVVYNSTLCYESLVTFFFGLARLSSLGESDSFEFMLRVSSK